VSSEKAASDRCGGFAPVEADRGVYRFIADGVDVVLLVTERLLEAIEESAWAQLRRSLTLPGLEQVVITPDVHTGYAVPIGFTAVSRTHLYPDTVGPDPACSVSLSRIAFDGFDALDKRARRAILDDLEQVIHVGGRHAKAPRPAAISFDELMRIVTGQRREPKTWVAASPPLTESLAPGLMPAFEEFLRGLVDTRLLRQIGSIGGGNHFVEVQLGENGDVYVMAHFGSRGLGAVGAQAFFERIRAACEADAGRAWSDDDMLFVEAGSRLGRLYFAFQQAMLEYATFNHVAVQRAATEVLCRHFGVEDATFLGHIPHNFIERRGGQYWQRKGATPAYDNQGIPLLIPGSLASASYVLAPGPNAERYGASVPHGAGRVLARGEAKRTLDQQEMDDAFDRHGVMGNFRHVPLDESTAAHKDVDEVIAAVEVSGVTRVVERLRPVLVLKGE